MSTRFLRPARLAPLAGPGFAVTTAAGFLLMGRNPEPDASTAAIAGYWAGHHAHVQSAAIVLAYGGVLFSVFGASIWARVRASAPDSLLAASVLVATAVATVGLLASATIYLALGDVAARSTTLPATLQGLHVLGTELSYPIAGGVELLLLAVAVAGISGRACPRWLAWTALPVALLQLTPVGFTAFLLFLAWSTVAGIALAARPAAAEARPSTPGSAFAGVAVAADRGTR